MIRRAVCMLVATCAAAPAGVAALAPAASASAARATSATRVTVNPRAVRPRTVVRLRFRMPPTATIEGLRDTDAIVVSGPRRRGCIGTAQVTLHGARPGTRMRVALRPGRLGGRWCVGHYTGTVVEREQDTCRPGPQHACPMVMVAPRTLAVFSFRVTKR